MQHFSHKLTTFFSSSTFFYIVMGFFIFEALWFAFSSLYPMAFDEDFHLGVIRIYAEQWSPFLTSQPVGAEAYGSLATDPSYFFHYLMSFPYRLIAAFTGSEATQVILLRLLNVALFAWSLVLFRRVMLRARASLALTHVSMAVFVLIPIVPQLAAHINYDNLLMLLIAWLCLVTFDLVDSFRTKRVDGLSLFLFLIICLFTSIVKYAALPLLVAAVLFVGIMAYRCFKGISRKRFLNILKDAYLRLSKNTKITLLAVLAIASILFVQRYGVNIVQYHHPVPDCGKVLSVESCMQYGPWGRDYNLEQSKQDSFTPNPITFMGSWLEGMRHRLFFAVSGAKTWFANYIELPVPVKTFTALAILGLLATLVWWRQVFRGNAYLAFFMLMTLIYCAVLWYDQYGMYKQTSVAVAINGRYLILILLPLAVIVGRAFALALARWKVTHLKPYVAGLVILLFLQGGGVFTFILRSDDSWYWPNETVRIINEGARDVLSPFIIEGDKHADWRDGLL